MLTLQVLPQAFAVCKLPLDAEVDWSGRYTFAARTDEELSLVCETAVAPENATAVETGWRGLKVRGVLDFGLVGILAGIAGVLAEAGISLFAASTYNTDYILINEGNLPQAIAALQRAGYTVD